MEHTFAHPILVGRYHDLPRGPRVRLRMAQPRDLPGVVALARTRGLTLGDLELARLARFDPRREATIVATALVDGAERVVGFGRIDAGASQPEVMEVDAALTEGLDTLLRDALVRRAAALDRAAA